MPTTSGVNVGQAIIDPKGKKPVRIGSNAGGVDMLSLGEKVKEATLARVKPQSDKIEKNRDVVLPAISALQTKIQSLRADAVTLSNYLGDLPGVANTFKDLQASVVKSGEFSGASYVDVTVDNTVAQATTNAIAMRVTQLAVVDSRITTTDTISKLGDSPITSANEPLGISGNFTINGGSTITVNATDSLYSITSAINSSNSNVQASYTLNGSNYYLTLNGTSLATPLTFVDSGNLLQTYFGINTTTPTDVSRLQAKIECDVVDGAVGVTTKNYSFNSNIVTDLIPGVTLKLLCTTRNSAGGYDNLNIGISHNTKEACDKIIAFFQHYNEVREILNRNLMMDDEGNPLDPEATMVRSLLIRKLNEELNTLSHFILIGAEKDDYRTCQDIGIVRDDTATGFQTGTYTISDPQKTLAAINNNFEKVKKLFGNYTKVSNDSFSVSSLGPELDPMLAGQPIKVTFSNVGGSYNARFACGSNDTGNVAQTSPYQLKGKKGSVFEKFVIAYNGPPIAEGSSVTFTLTATQGMAVASARMFDQTLDKDRGDFTTEVKRIQQLNEKLKAKVKKVEEEAERAEKKWSAQAVRADTMRTRYEQFSRQLDGMFNNNNRH